jgi:predicted nuclease of predicted toxin-antitoxin system
MRFLVDVNATGILCQWLIDMGHDLAQVGDRNPRMRDEEILRWAVDEKRIIVTTDKDFEEMIWREGRTHCGVLRLENLPRTARKRLLQDVLVFHSQALESGAIVIAESRKIRIRRR